MDTAKSDVSGSLCIRQPVQPVQLARVETVLTSSRDSRERYGLVIPRTCDKPSYHPVFLKITWINKYISILTATNFFNIYRILQPGRNSSPQPKHRLNFEWGRDSPIIGVSNVTTCFVTSKPKRKDIDLTEENQYMLKISKKSSV